MGRAARRPNLQRRQGGTPASSSTPIQTRRQLSDCVRHLLARVEATPLPAALATAACFASIRTSCNMVVVTKSRADCCVTGCLNLRYQAQTAEQTLASATLQSIRNVPE